jgi:hypothetical protein
LKVINVGAVLGAYVTVVAAYDGSQFNITPTAITLAATNIPPSTFGVPFFVNLNVVDIDVVMN